MAKTYTVKKGDTLWGISKQLGVSVSDLQKLNNIEGSTIHPGQELIVNSESRTPIIGQSQASQEQMVNFVKKVNPEFNSEIAQSFLDISKTYRIRGDIAFCQSIHETDYFRFTGTVNKQQNNFAGIGAVSANNVGHTFSTIKEGVEAQIQHLYAYATTEPLPTGKEIVDPRFKKVNRGSAPYWEDLAGKWAYPGYNRNKFDDMRSAFEAGDTYGQKILSIYEKVVEVSMSDKQNRSFKQYSINEFQKFIKNYLSIDRSITHIQIHHTWKPRKTDYTGERTILGMWRYHTETRGWDDIAQHFSVAPDGTIWDGRPLESMPAGIAGHNTGGLMYEIIGNFDKGEEELKGEQLDAVVAAIRVCMERFNLTKDDIVFHREHASKSCPGTGITKDWFIKQIEKEEDEQSNSGDEYPLGTAEWKKPAVDWLYEEGLLTGEEWKQKINEPLPLWAEAVVLKRIYDKLSSK